MSPNKDRPREVDCHCPMPASSSKDRVNLGVIAARGGSKGFPGKNLRKLNGRPLIEYSIAAAQHCRLLDDFLVSTDDQTTAQVALAAGAKVPFLRPLELATDDVPIWPVVLHATQQWEKLTGRSADAVVLLQATSPLRIPEDIDGSIRRFWDLAADICASVVCSHDSPYFNLVEPIPEASDLVKPCTAEMCRRARRQEVPPVYALNGAIFVYRRSILEGLTSQFLVSRYVIYEMPRSRSVDIDNQEDLELAEWYLSRNRQPIG